MGGGEAEEKTVKCVRRWNLALRPLFDVMVDIVLHSDCMAWQSGLEIPWNNEIVFAEKCSTMEFYKLYTVVLTVRVIRKGWM